MAVAGAREDGVREREQHASVSCAVLIQMLGTDDERGRDPIALRGGPMNAQTVGKRIRETISSACR